MEAPGFVRSSLRPAFAAGLTRASSSVLDAVLSGPCLEPFLRLVRARVYVFPILVPFLYPEL